MVSFLVTAGCGISTLTLELEENEGEENRFLAIRERRGEDIGVAYDIRSKFTGSYYSVRARVQTFSDQETMCELQCKRVYLGAEEARYESKLVAALPGDWVDIEYFFYIDPRKRHQLRHVEIGIFAEGTRDFAIDEISLTELAPMDLNIPPPDVAPLEND